MSLDTQQIADKDRRWRLECLDWPAPGWGAVIYASEASKVARLAFAFVQHPDVKAVRLVDREAAPRAAKALVHGGECQTDPSTRDVCEGMYGDKCDDVLKLQEALRAVYALAGESAEISKIVQTAIRETGGEG